MSEVAEAQAGEDAERTARKAPYMGDHVLHPFVADLVACHARADILRRMWLELDWEQHRHWATSEPGLATKAMVMAAAAKWGLGHAKVRVFQDVFDEVGSLLKIS